MVQINLQHVKALVSEINDYIKNERVRELFTTRPNIQLEVYRKTTIFYALKEYEENIESKPIIPHGFYTILEQELEQNGFLKTIKKYDHELSLISEVMRMDSKYIIYLLKELRKPNNVDTQEQIKARLELKEILRRFTSKYKEAYVKKLIDNKMAQLKKYTTVVESRSTNNHLLSIKVFENYITSNKEVKEALLAVINEKLKVRLTQEQLKELIYTTLSPDFQSETENILGIQKPSTFQTFISARALTRLNRSYLSELNKLYENATPEIKNLVIEVIKLKTKMRRYEGEEQSYYSFRKELTEKIQKLNALTEKKGLHIIEEASAILHETNIILGLNSNNDFEFRLPYTLTETDKLACAEYEVKTKQIRTIHNILYKLYSKQNSGIVSLTEKTETPLSINEHNYHIDLGEWLTIPKIKAIIDKIDMKKIDMLSEKHFQLLKKFLIEDGLLWAYVAENIDLNTFSKIINNFDAIASIYPEDMICISKLHEIIKTANMHDYTTDIIIGLVGQEIAAKVINYNQFSGVTVTDEIIHKRLRKLIDLAVRSEYINKSSLPFRCDVSLGDYKLQRYRNNDPSIFASGIDTKTCFFISVNENDFFFYSLLNKNGFVLKIVNKDNELIARATCFRKNNVFMINGIRCKNNKVHPESKEDKIELEQIVKLIELFAQKLIDRTKNDECPIDYVICNKAGILENSFFEDRYETVNPDFFREPINIYDEDWQEFVHLYDNQEQMLQEVPYTPDKSFTTDFGNHFPALLIKSRNYMGLTSPRNIALNDQPATYSRPKRDIEEYIGLEITDEILARINRIKALSCFIGTEEEQLQKQREFKLLRISDIQSIELGDDWYSLLKSDNTYEEVQAKPYDEEIKTVAILRKA